MWWIGAALAMELPEGVVRAEDVAWKSRADARFELTDETIAMEKAECLVETAVASDGALTVLGVGGCPSVIADVVRASVEQSTVKKSFAKDYSSVVILVTLERPALWRDRKSTISLDEALLVEEKPEKFYHKAIFRPPEVRAGACNVDLWLNAEGVPYVIRLDECREDLALGIGGAVSQWRYSPVVRDGVPVSVRFQERVATE